MSWATKPTLASWAGSDAGRPPQTSIVPGRRAEQPGGQVQQGALAGAVLPDQPGDPPGRDLEGAVRQRPPAAGSACPGRVGREDGGHATPRCVAAKGAAEQRLDALVVEPGRAGPGQPALEVAPQRLVRGERVVGERAGDEGADARAGRDQPVALELAVGLEHRVGVDGQRGHDVLDRRAAGRPRAAGRAAAPGAPAAPPAGTARRRSGRPG